MVRTWQSAEQNEHTPKMSIIYWPNRFGRFAPPSSKGSRQTAPVRPAPPPRDPGRAGPRKACQLRARGEQRGARPARLAAHLGPRGRICARPLGWRRSLLPRVDSPSSPAGRHLGPTQRTLALSGAPGAPKIVYRLGSPEVSRRAVSVFLFSHTAPQFFSSLFAKYTTRRQDECHATSATQRTCSAL